MSVSTIEGRLILAIQALNGPGKLSVREAAQAYNVPQNTLAYQLKGRTPKHDTRNRRHILTPTEEETLV